MVNYTFSTVEEARPGAGFTSPMLKTLLDVTGVQGTEIGAGLTYTSADIYLQQYDQGAARKGATSHVKLSMATAMLLPRTISASHAGGAGAMSVALICGSSNGIVAPITITSGESLPAVAAATESWSLGPASVNGVALTGLQSTEIDFGLSEILIGGDGEVYPTFYALDEASPRIGFGSLNLSYLATLGVGGVAVDASDVIAYFRKDDEGAGRVADGTAEHIKFTVDEGRVQPGDVTYAGQIVQGYEIIPIYDGTNATLVLSTASAIT